MQAPEGLSKCLAPMLNAVNVRTRIRLISHGIFGAMAPFPIKGSKGACVMKKEYLHVRSQVAGELTPEKVKNARVMFKDGKPNFDLMQELWDEGHPECPLCGTVICNVRELDAAARAALEQAFADLAKAINSKELGKLVESLDALKEKLVAHCQRVPAAPAEAMKPLGEPVTSSSGPAADAASSVASAAEPPPPDAVTAALAAGSSTPISSAANGVAEPPPPERGGEAASGGTGGGMEGEKSPSGGGVAPSGSAGCPCSRRWGGPDARERSGGRGNGHQQRCPCPRV